jgi:hypothetical protein
MICDNAVSQQSPETELQNRTAAMTKVQITLPDALAQEAMNAGLLAPQTIEHILRERLRADRIDRMQAARATLAAEKRAAMTPEEVNAEIAAYRAEQQRASGS